MQGSDPKQVIVDWLVRPSMVISESRGDGGLVVGQVRQDGQAAVPATIPFLKERSIPGRQIHAVAFESLMDGRRLNALSTDQFIQDDSGNWRMHGGSGGGDDGPIREHLWANLGGGGWPNEFCMGGRVIDNGLDIAMVPLVTGNELTLEDTVDDGLVLFLTDQRVELPIHAELYDRSGALVARREVISEPSCERQPA